MYKKSRILAIIPARKGSKGLPNKNIKPLSGRPLIAWTIKEAKKSRYLDRVVVTTDSKRIAGIAKNYGAEVPFIRPARLAADKTPMADVVLHALELFANKEKRHYDYFALLQPTSPLRTAKDIDSAIEELFNKKTDTLVSVAESSENPYWAYSINRQGFLKPVIKQKKEKAYRQGLPKCYRSNGAIYICSTKVFKKNLAFLSRKTVCYLMPKERSVDIDDSCDFNIAKMLLKKRISLRR